MTLEEAVYAMLSANSGVRSHFGSDPLRIYPNDRIPQRAAYPNAGYSKASQQYSMTLKGRVPTSMYSMRFAVNALTSDEMDLAAKSIDAALVDYSGTAGGGTVKILGVMHEDEDDAYFDPVDDGEQGVHQRTMTLTIWSRPA